VKINLISYNSTLSFTLDQDNHKKADSPSQANHNNNSNMNGNIHMSQERYNLHAQLQQHLSGGGYMNSSANGIGMISGSGMVGMSGNIVGNMTMLSELPEPPISVQEIGPIPPPPMFSSPSPTMVSGRAHGQGVHDYDYDSELNELF
jgi:hypothetical protein